MTSTELAPLGIGNALPDVQEDVQQQLFETLRGLEESGAATETGLVLKDDMTYDVWEAMGRFLGVIYRADMWWLGDWLVYGEGMFSGDDQWAQGVESTQKERYALAERVTGLDHGTLMNLRSVCARVLPKQRRKELGVWIHAEVAPLTASEQTKWLKLTIKNGWTRSELRTAMKATDADTDGGDDDTASGGGDNNRVHQSEQIARAARLVFNAGQSVDLPERGHLVPDEPWAQLAAALGEEK